MRRARYFAPRFSAESGPAWAGSIGNGGVPSLARAFFCCLPVAFWRIFRRFSVFCVMDDMGRAV